MEAPASMADSQVQPSSTERMQGYLDDVYRIFEAHQHAIVLVEEGGMRWMGLRTCPEHNLDLLVRDAQAEALIADILALGYFERIEQHLGYRLGDPMAKHVPCLRDTRYPAWPFSDINLWTETLYHLRIEHAELLAVPDIYAWNVNLMEERFGTVLETEWLCTSVAAKRGTKLTPDTWSSASGALLFIPAIPKMCDALLAQRRYRMTHLDIVKGQDGDRPGYHLRNFIRYLHLERPSQRKLLLSLVAPENREDMEQRIHAFKRKPLFTLAQLT